MIWAALVILVSGAAGETPQAETRGAEVAAARVSAQVLRPVIVRQASGLEQPDADAPRPQTHRRTGRILIEFE